MDNLKMETLLLNENRPKSLKNWNDLPNELKIMIFNIIKRNPPSIYGLFIKALTGETISIEVNSHSRVEQIKLSIVKKRGIPADQQRLIYAGKQLDDSAILAYCNIQSGSTIHLVLRQ